MVREGMRGDDQQQNHMFSYLSPEERVRKDHPLCAIRTRWTKSSINSRDGSTRCMPAPTVDRAGEIAAGATAADVLLDPQ
jgi:hypothetical protein